MAGLLGAIGCALTCPTGSSAAPAPRVTGGTVVASPTQAPWAVRIVGTEPSLPNAQFICSGSIIDATHVITAAHCLYDDGGNALSTFTVTAGTTNITSSGDESTRQVVSATGTPHPYYAVGRRGDDVGLLTLTTPLDLSGPAVKAVALATSTPPLGTTANIFGWGGSDSNGDLDGLEHTYAPSTVAPFVCGSGVPSLVCASATTGDICAGDSGGGLIDPTTPPTLFAVVNYAVARGCGAGDPFGYTDVTTPEVSGWLSGNASPPRAPRASSDVTFSGSADAGATLTCSPASWSPATSSDRFDFVNAQTNTVLQSGAGSAFTVPDQPGLEIECVDYGTNAGGTTASLSDQIYFVPPDGSLTPTLSMSISPNGTIDAQHAATPVPLTMQIQATNLNTGAIADTYTFPDSQAAGSIHTLPPGPYLVCLSTLAQGTFKAGQLCLQWTQSEPTSETGTTPATPPVEITAIRWRRGVLTVSILHPPKGGRVTIAIVRANRTRLVQRAAKASIRIRTLRPKHVRVRIFGPRSLVAGSSRAF